MVGWRHLWEATNGDVPSLDFDQAGWSSLLWACYKGHVNTGRLLVEKHADVNVHGQYYLTPLMWASGRGHASTVHLLLDSGARVNTGDKVTPSSNCWDIWFELDFQYGTTALIWACRKSYVDIVDMLLHAGANVDVSGMVVIINNTQKFKSSFFVEWIEFDLSTAGHLFW